MIDQVPARSPGGMPPAIGRYQVLERLGKGAMGVVYRARDDQLARDVAVKLLMTDVEDEPETRARFFREAQITSRLLHRNIVTVLDVGEDDGRLFIVMELLKGETLTAFLKRSGGATLEQQIDLMIQTCEGLAVAHAKGVVHRDIKPANLFVMADGSLKILDFGVARLVSSTMTASGLIIGTPDFMSPQQARGQEVDGRSDIFSTAAVFYLILTGRRPFDGPNLPAVLQRVVNDDPLPILEHEAPPVLAGIIAKGLRKDVNERYQRFADMVADLVRFKRQFDNETRQLALTARNRFDEVRRGAGEVKELRATLMMAATANVPEPEALEMRYPFLSAGSAGPPPTGPPAVRHKVVSILSDLQAAQGQITDELNRLRAAVQETERAENARLADAKLADARLAGVASDGAARLVLEEIRLVRSMFEAGPRDAAIARFSEFRRANPQLPGVAGELERLTADAERREAEGKRQAQLAQFGQEARAQESKQRGADARARQNQDQRLSAGPESIASIASIAASDDTVILATRSPLRKGFMAAMAERVRGWRRKRGSSPLGR